jgi:NADH-quinone oxidoreductase subunit L
VLLGLIPLLPLVGFLVNAACGRRLSKAVSGGIATGAMALSFGLAVAAVWGLGHTEAVGGVRSADYVVSTWIASDRLDIPLAFHLDPLSALMILVVTGIGTLIHLYSTAYMLDENDGEFARYFSYLNLFAAFMLVLVLGSSFPVMFIGWEGVGLCSYLLIGFWFTKPSAADAGKKAFIVNRIGDFGFVLGMFWLFKVFGTLDFQLVAVKVSALTPEATFGALTAITLLLFLGATGKSAQIPLYVWLPDAMEGPTPVSALIHAATMVTAGVYMIGRNAVLFAHAPLTMEIVAITGALTALMAGTIGLVQHDIKRVLAYSTVSQLGYMFLAMGVGAFAGGIFHLYTHAFFKALLFLGSGAVIHALHGEQDLRNMGGLRKALPITFWTFLIGTLAIAGVPLLSGFFSKDEILWRTYSAGHHKLWFVAVVTAFLTATYMFRLLYLTFFGERREPSTAQAAPDPLHSGPSAPHAAPATSPAGPGTSHAAHLHDAPPAMAIVLVVLAVGSIGAGYVGVPNTLVRGGNRIEAFLEPSFRAPYSVPEEAGPAAGEVQHDLSQASTELGLMALSTAAAVAGIGLATMIFLRRPGTADRLAERFSAVHRLLLRKYFVDEIYDAVIVQPVKRTSSLLLWRGVDAGVIDGTVNGVGLVVRGWSALLRRLQTGSVRAYAMALFVGVVVIVGYYLWQ